MSDVRQVEETRTLTLTIKLTADEMAYLKKLAADNYRRVGDQARYVLLRFMARCEKGPDA